MDELKKNKFLAGYLVVVVVGALALGWFFWSSWQSHQAAREEFDSAAQGVQQLESRPLYPNAENHRLRKEQVDAFAAKVDQLQSELMAYQQPINEAPEQTKFQNKLIESIRSIKSQAEFTKLGDGAAGSDFDLGLSRYLAELPAQEAVPDLEFQLEALKSLVEAMIQYRVSAIDSLKRQELPVEVRPAATAPEPPAGRRAAARGAAAKTPAGPLLPEDEVMIRYPFTIQFTGPLRAIEDVFNHMATSKDHFFAIREIRVENEKKEGPGKGTIVTSTDQVGEDQKDSTIILGGEPVSAWAAIDLVRFLPPGSSPEKSTAKTP